MLIALLLSAFAAPLDEAGLAETRVLSAPVTLFEGMEARHLAARLEQLDYRRVHHANVREGEYFWGDTHVVFVRRAYRYDGRRHRARVVDLPVVAGKISGPVRATLDPMTLAWDLKGRRARSVPVTLETLPAHVWQPVLALEDTRFFSHHGVDPVGLGRALVANARAGTVVQGGSTVTQQLVKNRRVGPERTLSRKVQEAGHAVIVDALYDKEVVLASYLNTVYLGHVDGLAVHGLGAASRVFFDKDAGDLTIAEAATLAAMVQAPNRLSPIRNPEGVRQRRDHALARMAELGWISEAEARIASAEAVRVRRRPPEKALGTDATRTLHYTRGVVVHTRLDPYVQAKAEAIRRQSGHAKVSLVAVDATTGDVLAWVGDNPRRQPGSTVKPFVALSAFSHCGLTPASRVEDGPLSVRLDDARTWSPRNADGRDRGVVTLQTALVESRNRPFVRVSEHCGRDTVARMFVDAGLPVGERPASLPLGSVETTPLALAGSYAAFTSLGRVWEPSVIARVETPAHRTLKRHRPRSHRIASAAESWLVRDLLEEVVVSGTGSRAAGGATHGKTGTSNGGRDAWFVGGNGSVVVAVWVGRDAGGLSGGRDAAPLAGKLLSEASKARPGHDVARPWIIVEGAVDPTTGLRVPVSHARAQAAEWKRGTGPRWDVPLVRDRPVAVLK